MAVGIKPNVELARGSGIDVNRGIIVNDYMETSISGIYAVGECAEHRGIAYGLVAPLYEQGAVLAKRLAGAQTEGYAGSVTSTKLKVSGVDVFSAGQFIEQPGSRSLRYQDEIEGVYKKLVIKEDKLVGAVLFGDTSDGAPLFSIIKNGENIKGKEKELLLGISSDALGSTKGNNRLKRWLMMRSSAAATGSPKERLLKRFSPAAAQALVILKPAPKPLPPAAAVSRWWKDCSSCMPEIRPSR